MPENALEDLINLDVEIVGRLKDAGIDTPELLRGSGAIGAYLACRDADEAWDDLETLFKLEGALRGIPWQEIPHHDRDAMQADTQTALDMGEF